MRGLYSIKKKRFVKTKIIYDQKRHSAQLMNFIRYVNFENKKGPKRLTAYTCIFRKFKKKDFFLWNRLTTDKFGTTFIQHAPMRIHAAQILNKKHGG